MRRLTASCSRRDWGMNRESLIRRFPELAFAALFGAGLVLGGGAALAGIPRFLDAALPGAQADVQGARDVVRVAMAPTFLKTGLEESRYAPQVLYPVTASPLPGWLTQAIH